MNEWDLNSARGEAQGGLTLRDVAAPLFRRQRLVILSFAGIFLGGLLAALFLPKQYSANMEILVKRERVDPVVTTEATPQGTLPAPAVTEDEINSEVEILRSHDLLEKVVAATGLQGAARHTFLKFAISQDDPAIEMSRAVERLGGKLQIEALTKTDLIQIGYQSPDPQLSHRVLEKLGDLYMEKHLEVHRPPGAFDFFQRETQQYQTNLADAEARLSRFSREQNVTLAQTERDMTLQKLNEFDGTYRNTETDISATQSRISDLQAQLRASNPRVTTSEKAIDDAPVLQVLEGALSSLELKHTEMTAHFEPDYPPLKDLEAQIAQARRQLEEVKATPLREDATDANPTYLWLTAEVAKSRADLATLQATAVATSQNMALYRHLALDLGQKQLEQEDLIRNAKVEEGNFLLYLNKREEARISDALDSKRIVNVAIAEAPTVPALPTRSPWFLLEIGTLLAVLISAASAFVADFIDPSLRSPADVEKILHIPILAAMPRRRSG
jgi:uncharacterized protein involved in exopolysaccharide biosynthesis